MKKQLAFVTVLSITFAMGLSACGQMENVAEEKREWKQESEETANAAEEKATQNAVEEKTAEEEAKNSTGEGGYSVVTGGYQFTLPSDVTATVNNQGLILTDENVNYQMLVTVRDYNFEEKKDTLDFFSSNVKDAGYEVTKEVELTSVADREWAYFNYLDEDGSNMLLAYSAADENHTFANLVLRYGDLSDEEILKETAEILGTAQKTDLPDTTLDDIVEMEAERSGNASADVQEYASSVKTADILVGDETVTVSVPEDFYIMNFSLEEESSAKSFVSKSGTVELLLMGEEENYYGSLEDWVKEFTSIPEEAQDVSKSGVQTEQVGDVTVAYQIASYEEESSYSGETNTYIVLEAVGELPQGGYIQLEAETTEENGLNFEMIKEFFQIEK